MKEIIVTGLAIGVAYTGGIIATYAGLAAGNAVCKATNASVSKFKKWKARNGKFVDNTTNPHGEKIIFDVEVVRV